MPPELANGSRYVRDLLDEYRTYSKGKLRFEAIDPGSDKKLEEEANACKVNKLQVQVLRSQKFEVGSYYLGLCFKYQGQDEAIAEIGQPEGLEYQISSLIKRMTQKKRKIAFTTGHGEHDLSEGFQALKHVLSQEFETTTVNPSSADIGEDIDALVIGGPRQAFDDKARHAIDHFLMKGKGAIFLVDGMVMSAPRNNGQPEMPGMPKFGQANDAGLGDLLGAYGFKINPDFVLDEQNVPGPVEYGGRRMLANYPAAAGNATANPLASCAAPTDAQGSGKLRLTSSATGLEGGVFASTSVPTSQGLDVTFNSYQYGGSFGADGIAFVLAAVDPANPATPSVIGQSGGSLGYSAQNSNNAGLSHGYLGVGIDAYGNYSNKFEGTGCTDPANIAQRMPGQVVVRGPGNGTVGYCAAAEQRGDGDLAGADPAGHHPGRLAGSGRGGLQPELRRR